MIVLHATRLSRLLVFVLSLVGCVEYEASLMGLLGHQQLDGGVGVSTDPTPTVPSGFLLPYWSDIQSLNEVLMRMQIRHSK